MLALFGLLRTIWISIAHGFKKRIGDEIKGKHANHAVEKVERINVSEERLFLSLFEKLNGNIVQWFEEILIEFLSYIAII